jgi:hypothetical protein
MFNFFKKVKKTKHLVYTIRIIYKSGASMEFNCLSFSINGGQYKWECADGDVRPVLLGVDEVAAVWQVAHKEIERPELP